MQNDNNDKNKPVSTNISEEEKILLDNANDGEGDDAALQQSTLDNTDNDGTPLNEKNLDVSGEDLDVPGAEADDANEAIGKEDEENNVYSQADTD